MTYLTLDSQLLSFFAQLQLQLLQVLLTKKKIHMYINAKAGLWTKKCLNKYKPIGQGQG
jgi:hypothetical protein